MHQLVIRSFFLCGYLNAIFISLPSGGMVDGDTDLLECSRMPGNRAGAESHRGSVWGWPCSFSERFLLEGVFCTFMTGEIEGRTGHPVQPWK